MLRTAFRSVRRLTSPVSRPAALFLAWSNRHTIMLWFRSIRHELTTRGVDLGRLKTLVRALWDVSRDPRVSNSRSVRRLTLDGGTVVADTTRSWKGRRALDERLAIVNRDRAEDPADSWSHTLAAS